MANLLTWAGNVAKGIGRDINPFDNGASHSNPNPQQRIQQVNQLSDNVGRQLQQQVKSGQISNQDFAQKYGQALNAFQQVQHPQSFNPQMQAAKSFANGVGNFVSPFYHGGIAANELARQGIANATGNKAAAANAKFNVNQNAGQFVTPFTNLARSGVDLTKATGAIATNNTQARQNALDKLNEHATNSFMVAPFAKLGANLGTSLGVKSVADSNNYSDEVKNAAIQKIQEQYGAAGLNGLNDPNATRKILAQGAEGAINLATLNPIQRAAGIGEKVAGQTLTQRLIPAIKQNVGLAIPQTGVGLAQQDNVTAKDAGKQLAQNVGAAIAVPLVAGVAGSLVHSVKTGHNPDTNAHEVLKTQDPAYQQLQSTLEQNTKKANYINQTGEQKSALPGITKNIQDIQTKMAQMRQSAIQSGAIGKGATAAEVPDAPQVGKTLPTELQNKINEFNKKTGVDPSKKSGFVDATPNGYGPKSGTVSKEPIQLLKGESYGDAIKREVSQQVDNGRVIFTESPQTGVKAVIDGDRVITGLTKKDVYRKVWEEFNPHKTAGNDFITPAPQVGKTDPTLPKFTDPNGPEATAKARASVNKMQNPVDKQISYLNTTKKQILDEATRPTAQELPKGVQDTLNNVKLSNQKISNVKAIPNEVKGLFTPDTTAKDSSVINDLRATLGNNALKTNQEAIGAKNDVNLFKDMSTGDHLNFIQKIEQGIPQATPELQAQAEKFRASLEKDYTLAQTIKADVNHIDNYFPRAGFWDNSKGQVDAFLSKWVKPTLGGKPAALEARSIPTIYDGIKAGLVPKESNPALIALNNRAQLLKASAAEQFKTEQIAKGADPISVQKHIDQVMSSSAFSKSPVFQSVKSVNNALNSIQLGLSGFHVAGTALNATTSQFANGLQDIFHGHPIKGVVDMAKAPIAPIEYIFKGNQILKDNAAGKITPDIQNIAEGGGRIGQQVDYRATGLAKSLEQFKTGNPIEIAKGTAAAPFRAFNTAAKPIMEWWVPRIKAGATKALIDRKLSELGTNASPEAIRAAKAAAIDSIDNRFGQLVQDNLMWNKTLKDGMSLMMRSPGWNIGTVREIGGGITDLATKTARGKGVSERTAYTASLAATTMMIGAAMNYMFTGQVPQSAIDYFYPKTGQTDKNGNAERVSLPTYAKDVFAFSHNPVQTIGNKLSPGLGIGKQLATNSDYFGNMIRNPQDSAGTQAKQVGTYLAKNTLPFTVTSGNQRAEKSPSTAVQSFFGVTPAPGYITKSNFQQQVADAIKAKKGSVPLTPEQSALVNDKSAAKVAFAQGDASKIDKLVQSGQMTQKQADNLKAASQNTSLANSFNYLLNLDRPTAAKLLKNASPEDIAKLGDTTQLLQDMASTTKNKLSTDSTKQASQQILDTLNNTGKDTATLVHDKNVSKAVTAKSTGLTPQEKYTKAVEQYNVDKAAGTISPVQDIARQKGLNTQKFNSTQNQDIVTLHGLSKAEVYNYLSNDPNGAQTAKDLLAYDKAAKAAGIQSTTKFVDKYGNENIKPKVAGTSRRGTGRLARVKMPKINSKVRQAKFNVAKVRSIKQPKLGVYKKPKTQKIATV